MSPVTTSPLSPGEQCPFPPSKPHPSSPHLHSRERSLTSAASWKQHSRNFEVVEDARFPGAAKDPMMHLLGKLPLAEVTIPADEAKRWRDRDLSLQKSTSMSPLPARYIQQASSNSATTTASLGTEFNPAPYVSTVATVVIQDEDIQSCSEGSLDSAGHGPDDETGSCSDADQAPPVLDRSRTTASHARLSSSALEFLQAMEQRFGEWEDQQQGLLAGKGVGERTPGLTVLPRSASHNYSAKGFEARLLKRDERLTKSSRDSQSSPRCPGDIAPCSTPPSTSPSEASSRQEDELWRPSMGCGAPVSLPGLGTGTETRQQGQIVPLVTSQGGQLCRDKCRSRTGSCEGWLSPASDKARSVLPSLPPLKPHKAGNSKPSEACQNHPLPPAKPTAPGGTPPTQSARGSLRSPGDCIPHCHSETQSPNGRGATSTSPASPGAPWNLLRCKSFKLRAHTSNPTPQPADTHDRLRLSPRPSAARLLLRSVSHKAPPPASRTQSGPSSTQSSSSTPTPELDAAPAPKPSSPSLLPSRTQTCCRCTTERADAATEPWLAYKKVAGSWDEREKKSGRFWKQVCRASDPFSPSASAGADRPKGRRLPSSGRRSSSCVSELCCSCEGDGEHKRALFCSTPEAFLEDVNTSTW